MNFALSIIVVRSVMGLLPNCCKYPMRALTYKSFNLYDSRETFPKSDEELNLNQRFSLESIKIAKGDCDPIGRMRKALDDNQKKYKNKIVFGVVLLPESNFIVPISNGMIQPQHLTNISSSSSSSVDETMLICGFNPRAGHISISPFEEERPTNTRRLTALNAALIQLTSTTGEELMDEQYAGTPPARIYRSFVAPRINAVHILEPIERAANRTAMQIELAVRQVRADKANYLRNTDNPGRAVSNETEGSLTAKLNPIALVLDNLRSAFNVGSIFRTAETGGVKILVTCGITPHPPHPKLSKTALTATEMVPSKHYQDTLTAIRELKDRGYTIAVMETTSRSSVYTEVVYPEKLALVVGNEVTGVDTRIIEEADMIVEIPTFGVKNSLNVASALPIVLFEVLRQWRPKTTG